METLKALLKAKKMSQRELGKRIGCSESTISQYVNGKRSPDYETLLKIAEELETTVDYLLRGNAKPATDGDGRDLVNGDEELTELLERARDDPHIRMLFRLTKGATPEDVEKAIKIIQTLRGE